MTDEEREAIREAILSQYKDQIFGGFGEQFANEIMVRIDASLNPKPKPKPDDICEVCDHPDGRLYVTGNRIPHWRHWRVIPKAEDALREVDRLINEEHGHPTHSTVYRSALRDVHNAIIKLIDSAPRSDGGEE